jgi:acyl-CoA synthetase (AMP-forming)/AMP-acid ligase II
MLPSLTIEDFEQRFADRHLIHGAVEKWARERPEEIALIDSDRDQGVTSASFDQMSTAVALNLLEAGFRKGDCFATVLPLTSEHLFLEYACFKIGVVFVPLDLRLGPAELRRSLELVDAKGLAFTKCPAVPDAGALLKELGSRALRLLLQSAPESECIEGATPVSSLLRAAMNSVRSAAGKKEGELREAYATAHAAVGENDGALVIFTTGSTGSPKPALLSHRNVSCQAMCISRLLSSDKPLMTLVNLPASHVGCQTELLMGTLFEGGTAVLVPVFDPSQSMRAIAKYGVTAIGQIPAMFQFEWRLKDYESFDLSSLDFAAYGGQQVSSEFIAKMASMATSVGTGLGLTEAAGFCTYIRRERARAGDCVSTLGTAQPVYPMTIRGALREDGAAGAELPAGALGHVCFKGPQTFLGYLNDPIATASAVSSDGFLYTGDMGYHDSEGLHLSGRAKLVIKPSGYQVFPGDVERHFSALPEVATCTVVGIEHPVISEAIVAFVEMKQGAELTPQALEKHARELTTYMRPRHYVLLNPGETPLNRVAKADYLILRERAKREVEQLKAKGLWR